MESIIREIDSHKGSMTYEDSFRYAILCSKLLNKTDKTARENGRLLLTFVLDRLVDFPKETYAIWSDLVEAAGFYPYIQSESDLGTDSLSEQIRVSFHSSNYLYEKTLHAEQKKLSDLLFAGKNVVASAPTSFGKSMLIEELVASGKYKNIVIIQPTLALLDEIRLKLKKYARDYKIIVRTAQTPSNDEKGNLFLLTAERVMEYDGLPNIDLFIIDEFYKMSLRRIDDRADTLNNAFLKVMRCGKPQFYLLGPNIGGISEGFEQKYNALFYKTDFSMVGCRVIDKSITLDATWGKRQRDAFKEKKLFELLDELGDSQSIIYCASPARARKVARNYYLHLKELSKSTMILPLVEWIKANVSDKWSLADALTYGIAVHDGSLQKHISSSVIHYFNIGKLRTIFCTSTIIEGVNTSAKNVIIFDEKKGSKPFDYFDYSNIRGRAGRMMEHYIGNVYSFVQEPQKDELIVDIPFVEQDRDILTDEILVNIEPSDIKPQVKERYDKLQRTEPGLLRIIKQNGTNINGQISIYYALERDISDVKNRHLITWSQYPSYEAMTYVMDLANENIFNFRGEHGVLSVKQLVRMLHVYREKKTIMAIVNDKLNYLLKKRKNTPNPEQLLAINDSAIEEAFHVYRHWFQFKVPKAFRVVDSIQRYVCEKHGIKAGSYSFYVQQLENDFVSERLSILIEYGIPNTTILKIQDIIPYDLKDEAIVEFLRDNKNEVFARLTSYEIERLSCEL